MVVQTSDLSQEREVCDVAANLMREEEEEEEEG
jgi:hypothetical protein